jgi:PEP-CTERM motif
MSRIIRLALASVFLCPTLASAQNLITDGSVETNPQAAGSEPLQTEPSGSSRGPFDNATLAEAAQASPPSLFEGKGLDAAPVTSAVAEPGTLALMLAGLGVVVFVARRYGKT